MREIKSFEERKEELVKLGKESEKPEVILETNTYHSGENGLKGTHDLVFEEDRYYYRKRGQIRYIS